MTGKKVKHSSVNEKGYRKRPVSYTHLDVYKRQIPSITGTFLSRQASVGGLANQNCGGKDHNDAPAASRVRGGDRARVVSSKTPTESVNDHRQWSACCVPGVRGCLLYTSRCV